MKRIAILGSTGSIGTQTLDVVREHAGEYEAYALTAGHNAELLIAQAREFRPEAVVGQRLAHRFVARGTGRPTD